MVESNVALASEDPDKIERLPETVRADPISTEQAQANVSFLRTQAESWLAVLFNVFGSVGRDNQNMVGDVVSAWISIADAKVREQLWFLCNILMSICRRSHKRTRSWSYFSSRILAKPKLAPQARAPLPTP